MKPWLSMMPVSGDSNAPMQDKLRLDRARRVAADHLQALDAVDSPCASDRLDLGELGLVGRDDQLAAFACGTPCEAQNSYSMRRPRTQWRARSEPVG